MEEYIKENNLDEIDAFLMKEFGIMGGACSAQKSFEYNVARQVAEKLWKKKEPVSVDLEEASRNYADDEEYGDDIYFAIKAAFKDGANWKEKQMMKNAVYGLVCGHDESTPAWIDLNLLNKPQNVKVGDEVKLIIIKEE